MIEYVDVNITNTVSTNGLFLDVADFLREQARVGVIFEITAYRHLLDDERSVSLRQLKPKGE